MQFYFLLLILYYYDLTQELTILFIVIILGFLSHDLCISRDFIYEIIFRQIFFRFLSSM